jgi:hypothetical protein
MTKDAANSARLTGKTFVWPVNRHEWGFAAMLWSKYQIVL